VDDSLERELPDPEDDSDLDISDKRRRQLAEEEPGGHNAAAVPDWLPVVDPLCSIDTKLDMLPLPEAEGGPRFAGGTRPELPL